MGSKWQPLTGEPIEGRVIHRYDSLGPGLVLVLKVAVAIVIFWSISQEILGQDSTGHWSGLLLLPCLSRANANWNWFHHPEIPSCYCTTLTSVTPWCPCVSQENGDARDADKDAWIPVAYTSFLCKALWFCLDIFILCDERPAGSELPCVTHYGASLDPLCTPGWSSITAAKKACFVP